MRGREAIARIYIIGQQWKGLANQTNGAMTERAVLKVERDCMLESVWQSIVRSVENGCRGAEQQWRTRRGGRNTQ